MKAPKIVCIAGAPAMTAAEGGIVAGLVYVIYLIAIKIGCALVGPVNTLYSEMPSADCLRTPTAEYVMETTVKGLCIAALVLGGIAGFVLWSRYNYQRCQDFWAKQIASEAPLPVLGVIKRKPPKAICITGSPLVTILELALIGGVLWLAYIFFTSLPAPTPEPAPTWTPAEWQAHVAHMALAGSIVKVVAVSLMSVILAGMFVIWSKWNYTLCRRFWANR